MSDQRDFMYELAEELTQAFIQYQYQLEHPMPVPENTTATMHQMYRENPQFRCKVENLTQGVMHIVNKHCTNWRGGDAIKWPDGEGLRPKGGTREWPDL